MALWFGEENLPNRLRLCLGDETITCWSKGILWKLKQVGMALLFLHFFYLHERELLRLHRNLFLYKTYSSFCRHLKRASISYGVLGRDDSLDHPPMWRGFRSRTRYIQVRNRTWVTSVGDARSAPCIIADPSLQGAMTSNDNEKKTYPGS